ncbi:MAG: orotidine-5'-phosphate decarboxylase [Turicibacter sp.]
MNRDIIIALDFKNLEETKTFIEKFDQSLYVKVGMELFYAEGPQVINYLKEKNHKIFLDLKLHDIPNTVKSAMKNLARLGVDMVNVHAAGTVPMMRAAVDGLTEGTPEGMKRPLCIAVTQLTSTSEEIMQSDILIKESLADTVLHYATKTKEAGLDGIVCSALEVEQIHEVLGAQFITVTPGIRQASDSVHDQKSVVTPEQAAKLGSDYIVVGRSITNAKDPVATYNTIAKQFLG